jgi:hypothetical protein
MADTIESFNKKLLRMREIFLEDFKKRVEEKTPVRTGALKAGWSWINPKSKNASLTNEQEYWVYVEYGTEKMAPVAMVGTTVVEGPRILEEAKRKAGI